jgi:hypothetical protein
MEWRSGRSSQLQLGSPGGGADRISALPDDLLHLVLARLGCAAAAARTGVLSRRWRDGVWTRIPEIVLRDVPFRSLEAAVGGFSPGVSLLEIRVPEQQHTRVLRDDSADSTDVDSLLRAAARLAPKEFVFAFPPGSTASSIDVDLPCFRHATSIVLDSVFFFVSVPEDVEFPALLTPSLSGCIVDLDSLLSRCPRLRVLRLKPRRIWVEDDDLTVHSASLQELVVDTEGIQIPQQILQARMVTFLACLPDRRMDGSIC